MEIGAKGFRAFFPLMQLSQWHLPVRTGMLSTMFLTVQTDLVCGRAQYGPVYRRDRTGLDHETAVLHWTSPKIMFYCTSYSEAEILNHIKNLIHLTIIPSCKSISGLSSLRTPSSVALITLTCASPMCDLSRSFIHSTMLAKDSARRPLELRREPRRELRQVRD